MQKSFGKFSFLHNYFAQMNKPPDLELLKISQAAEILQQEKTTVWRLCREGKLPHIRLSARTYRIRRADLEAFINARAR